jgi:predicted dehydrogenase
MLFRKDARARHPATLMRGTYHVWGMAEELCQSLCRAQAYSDWKQMIDTEELDIVSVCT